LSDSSKEVMIELDNESTKTLSNILRALAHPKRIEIISYLSSSQREYSAILRNSGISRTALANHLNLLVENGLVERIERGSYSLSKDGNTFYQSIIQTYHNSKARSSLERIQLLEKYSYRPGKGENELKILNKLKWQPRWVSHMGVIEGSLKFLNQKISTGWLYGGTGHAFIINIHEGLCPSGPTAWMSKMLFELAPNLGYRIEGVFARKSDSEFPRLQEKAWAHAKKSIDNGIPCYGWELEIAEYYVIKGYDGIGYHYSGPHCDDGKGPKPWKELGTSGLEFIEVYSVHPTDTANPKKAIKEALEKALHHASNPPDIIFPGYRSGLKGFDFWISAIEDGSALSMGHSYNAAVWAECRKYAVQFLKEAKKYVESDVRDLLDDAKKQYEIVEENLESVTKDHPFTPALENKPLGVEERTKSTLESLKRAKVAEASGLDILKEVVKKLS